MSFGKLEEMSSGKLDSKSMSPALGLCKNSNPKERTYQASVHNQ